MRRTPDWPARRSDPLSSHIAAAAVQQNGTRGRQQNSVLQLVHRFPGLTACELAMHSELDRYQISRRLPELEACEVIFKGEIRESKVTGNMALEWHPVTVPAKEPTLF